MIKPEELWGTWTRVNLANYQANHVGKGPRLGPRLSELEAQSSTGRILVTGDHGDQHRISRRKGTKPHWMTIEWPCSKDWNLGPSMFVLLLPIMPQRSDWLSHIENSHFFCKHGHHSNTIDYNSLLGWLCVCVCFFLDPRTVYILIVFIDMEWNFWCTWPCAVDVLAVTVDGTHSH